MLLFLPERLYKSHKDIIDLYQEKAKELMKNETLYKDLVSYVSENIDNEKYNKTQKIWMELYNKLFPLCDDDDKEELYLCFNEEKAAMELIKCKSKEVKLYCLYIIITTSQDLPLNRIHEFETLYGSLSLEEINSLSDRIILAHYLNLLRISNESLESYDDIYKYIEKLLKGVPNKFKTTYFLDILKHHIVQYLPYLMVSAIQNSYKTKISNQQETLTKFKTFVFDTIDLIKYNDYEYSFHYMKLCILFDGLVWDLTNGKEHGNFLHEYFLRFKKDQKRAFFASNSHNYDPKELLDFVAENKNLATEMYDLLYN